MGWFAQIGFGAPAMLWALLSLPVIWWLLRLTPPSPRREAFPPTRLLLQLMRKEETPARSPWWLTLLRLMLAAAVILALSEPILKPDLAATRASGPIWIVVDNGWGAARDWPQRMATAKRLIDGAKRAGRPVVLTATADGDPQGLTPKTPEDAEELLRALQPRPWPARRAALVEPLSELAERVPPAEIVWISGPLSYADGEEFAGEINRIAESAPVTIYRPGDAAPQAIVDIVNSAGGMDIQVRRPASAGAVAGRLTASDLKGRPIADTDFSIPSGESDGTARLDLPSELRNEIARLEIRQQGSAGAVFLVDERWRRRTVGLISGSSADLDQPLLSPLHYLSRALQPFADLRQPATTDIAEAISELRGQSVSVIMMADIGRLVGESAQIVDKWITGGGLLVRFAGPRMAAASDELVPVRLRVGGRTLGGSMTWNQPQKIATVNPQSPIGGVTIPDEVEVTRQVLAEPDADLPDKTWMSLADGTPLITASRHGRGWIVLFHVTADTTWSNLPISGAFVDVLRRIVAFSSAAAAETGAQDDPNAEISQLPPMRLLDGFGRFQPPTPTAKPIGADRIDELAAAPDHPPGYYGTGDGFRALNLLKPDAQLMPIAYGALEDKATFRDLSIDGPTDLRPWLFGAALLALFADALAVLIMAGGLFARRPTVTGTLLLCGLFLAPADWHAHAQETDAAMTMALQATSKTRLAYVVTGNDELDSVSQMGLSGLTQFLTHRTALEPAPPLGLRIDRDELAFFSLIYWPIDPSLPAPSAAAMTRVDGFLKNGGTILFDTRDQLNVVTAPDSLGISPATRKLREILSGLDIPPLEPVPNDHVLTKSFYILQDFPGRWSGSPLWVEALANTVRRDDRPVRAGDGVSPILITANDFAGAWAITKDNQFAYPTVPADPRQRELAFRVGVNIVMYSMTGNYKADQVHIPALLERLGQ